MSRIQTSMNQQLSVAASGLHEKALSVKSGQLITHSVISISRRINAM